MNQPKDLVRQLLNLCERANTAMIVTQHLSDYGIRRAMGMKRRERESRSLPNKSKDEQHNKVEPY
jgi:hypothetical protein